MHQTHGQQTSQICFLWCFRLSLQLNFNEILGHPGALAMSHVSALTSMLWVVIIIDTTDCCLKASSLHGIAIAAAFLLELISSTGNDGVLRFIYLYWYRQQHYQYICLSIHDWVLINGHWFSSSSTGC